jgi:hypothetical protein
MPTVIVMLSLSKQGFGDWSSYRVVFSPTETPDRPPIKKTAHQRQCDFQEGI